MKNDSDNLVSLLIPSYNKPDLLYRALESVFKQNYRPLQIIVVDDNSPVNLSFVLELFDKVEGVSTEYHRNKKNLKPYWNMLDGRKYVNGKYLIYLPHDDYFIDEYFISDAIQCFQRNEKCNLVVANSIVENTTVSMMNLYERSYIKINGDLYLKDLLWSSLHPSYSAVIFNNDYICKKGYETFILKKDECMEMDIEPDEFFLSVVLAAEDSEVFVSGRAVSVRGNPSDSYSKSEFWKKRGAESCFLPAYNIYDYFRNKGKTSEALCFSRIIVSTYPTPRLNLKVLKFLNFKNDAVALMLLSVLCYWIKSLLKSPNLLKSTVVRVYTRLLHWLA